jgi:CRP-like cAMP-binding protein
MKTKSECLEKLQELVRMLKTATGSRSSEFNQTMEENTAAWLAKLSTRRKGFSGSQLFLMLQSKTECPNASIGSYWIDSELS